jgi:hypothetical protein
LAPRIAFNVSLFLADSERQGNLSSLSVKRPRRDETSGYITVVRSIRRVAEQPERDGMR